ncbi:MAG: hypothetical protein ACOVO6_05770, partial [Burkholderiaceae bacterium]
PRSQGAATEAPLAKGCARHEGAFQEDRVAVQSRRGSLQDTQHLERYRESVYAGLSARLK